MGSPFRRSLRGRGLRWAAAVALAVIAGATAAGVVQRAEEARRAFGELRPVPVARTDLAVGTVLTEADLAWRELPAALVPAGAAAEPTGRTVIEPVVAGEVVLDRRLSPGGAGGLAALVPPGGRALAVPVGPSTPTVSVGDRVDLFSPAEPARALDLAEAVRTQGAGARRVARSALVVDLGDQAVTVAVAGSEAAAVARAVLDGAVTVAVVGPGSAG